MLNHSPRAAFLRRSCLLLAALLLAAVASWADDVGHIDQACALAGCFPGDAPGFPVTISQAGSYRLDSNLAVDDPSATAIFISVTPPLMVTLDLGGFTISGPYRCDTFPPHCLSHAGIGIDSQNVWQLTVRNGAIRDFGLYGIRSSQMLAAEEVTLSNIGGEGIHSYGGRLRDLSVNGTRLDGVHIVFGSVFDSDFAWVSGDAVELVHGLVRGISSENIDGVAVRFTGSVGGYTDNELWGGASGGQNLGHNFCYGPCS